MSASEAWKEMTPEKRAWHLRGAGRKYPECTECQEIYFTGGFGPTHEASSNCESGKQDHCTCDVCF